MNKKILLTLLLVFAVIFSVSAISASDANVTDSYATNLVDDTQDVSVLMENTADSSESSVSSDSNVDNDPSKVSLSSEEVLESGDSNTLSTNIASDASNGSSEVVSVSSSDEDIISATIDKSKTVQGKDITKYYKGSTQYTATFLDNNGKPLSKTNVEITVNGVKYTKKTNTDGVASLGINLKPGTYKVVATNPVTGYQLTNTFKILNTIKAKDMSKVREDSKKFSATFLKSDGNPLANKNIKFKVNGKTYNVKTNSKGVATLSLVSLQPGTYKIISYNTDGLSVTNKIKVYKQVGSKLTTSTYTFLKSDSKTIKVTLHNSLGYAPGKGKIVKIKINGKTYSKKTNSNGVASLKLPTLSNGVYTVKYTFEGNAYYKPSSASNKVVIIPSKTPKFTVKSGTTFNYGTKFKIAVTSGSVPLIKKTITFKVDGKTYTKTTDNSGIVSLPVNLAVGKHTVSYSISKDSKINAKSASSLVTVKEKTTSQHNAYWVYGGDMNDVKLKDLSSKGITDIFLNFYAYNKYGKSAVESWIASASSAGIKVHMWVQVFYEGGKWVNPVSGGKENSAFFKTKINEMKKYAALKGIAGIHMDYLRYPGTAYKTSGGTAAISSFVKQAVTAIKSVNSNILVSAALMPEKTDNKYYYGQDYSALTTYLDIVIPMVYKGNYNAGTSWITSTTKWFVDNSKGALVWTGLQSYVSDDDTTVLSASNLKKDIVAALDGKATGVVLFRYGLSNNVDFNSISASSSTATGSTSTSTSSSTKTVSIKDIVTGATNVKKFISEQKRIPNTVTIGGTTYSSAEFLYLMSQAIYQIGNSNTNAVSVISGVKEPESPFGDTISSKELYKADFITVAKNVANYIKNNKQAPNYASSAVGNIIYSELVDSFSRILAFYGSNSNSLPNYVTVTYSSSSSSSSSGASGSGLNEKNTIADLSAYLKDSKNCDVDNSKLKSLVSSLTKGLTTAKQKATAIFNYVRDSISYSFYYDTKYGAVGTYNAKTGNCVDQSHLLVALFRTADLPARYVHGTCKFSSGSTYGHVWTQVLIDGTWTVADATSSRNSLGNIANWNTNSYSLHGKYVSLSF